LSAGEEKRHEKKRPSNKPESFKNDYDGERPHGRAMNRLIPLLQLGTVSLFLYLNLFTFSNVPYLIGGDQTWFWSYALRMLQGDRVFRDFFQFTPPGTDFFYLGLFRALGPKIWVTDLAVMIVGIALCWICFHIATQIMDRDWALLASALFLVFVYGRLLDATHHWFSLLAVLGAVRIVMPERTLRRLAAAGALLGVASFFTQTAGFVGALAFVMTLLWERVAGHKPWQGILRELFALLSPLCLVWCALTAYFLVNVGWKQLWYLWVVYPQLYVTHQLFRPGLLQHLTLSTLSTLAQRVSIYVLTISVYPVVWWHCWRKRREPGDHERTKLLLLSLCGVFLLLEVIGRANWVRIYCVSMPAVLLFIWLLANAGFGRRWFKAVVWALVVCSALSQTIYRHRHSHEVVNLPAGRAVLSSELYESDELSWLEQHTNAGELFFQAEWLNIYFPLRLRNPVFAEFLSEAMPPRYLDLTLEQIEQKQVKYILSSRWLPTPETNITGHRPLDPFRAYLIVHYAPVQTFENQDVVWQRK
jgi:hypothetical protein